MTSRVIDLDVIRVILDDEEADDLAISAGGIRAALREIADAAEYATGEPVEVAPVSGRRDDGPPWLTIETIDAIRAALGLEP